MTTRLCGQHTSQIGLATMFEESQLAKTIMHRLANRGIAVFPIHDSFLVSNLYAEQLEVCMREVFHEATGNECGLSFDRNNLRIIDDSCDENDLQLPVGIFDESTGSYEEYIELLQDHVYEYSLHYELLRNWIPDQTILLLGGEDPWYVRISELGEVSEINGVAHRGGYFPSF